MFPYVVRAGAAVHYSSQGEKRAHTLKVETSIMNRKRGKWIHLLFISRPLPTLDGKQVIPTHRGIQFSVSFPGIHQAPWCDGGGGVGDNRVNPKSGDAWLISTWEFTSAFIIPDLPAQNDRRAAPRMEWGIYAFANLQVSYYSPRTQRLIGTGGEMVPH